MKKVISTLFLLTVFSAIFAQNRTCGTMAHQDAIEQTDPTIIKSRKLVEDKYQEYISNPLNLVNGRLVVTIPVVVHVVYNTTTQNISQAQIQSQIDILNKDFRKLNADTSSIPTAFKSVAADCEVQFCLAQRDPSGNATTGITRTQTSVTSFIDDDKVKYASSGGHDIWDRNKYLNLWVCNLGNGLLGYAQFPGGTAATDGVVIGYTCFGSTGTAASPYNKGRTATHEIGHWLNLYHTFQGGCAGTTNSNCSTAGDRVCDTPPTSTANYGCPSTQNTCTETSPFPSPYTSNQNDMTMNYMDYVDDACMYLFTTGQKARMQALFATGGSRVSLVTSDGCMAVNGAPTPDFTANKTTICVGQSVIFTNASTGSPTSYSWTFTGGTPATSTATNPTVTYSTAGTYTVSLTASNANGSNTKTQTAYITVLATTALPVTEGFQATFPPTGWSIGNADNSTITWAQATTAGGYGTSTSSAVFNNYDLNAVGTKDYLYTPAYSFSGVTNGYLKFDYAYGLYNATSADTLEFMYSTDCGTTWTSIWKKGGSALATVASATSAFTPSASQWKTDSVSLTAVANQSSVRFAIVNTNKYGNKIYVDNINIYNKAANVAPVANFSGTPTTVTVGNSVAFTDLSTNTPTSWSWSFSGGTPATSTTQNPTITYNTVGTYPVTLVATNSIGSNTMTKTAYINVVAATTGGCDTLANLVATDSARIYLTAAGVSSYISGHNTYGDLAKAEKYTGVPAGNQVTGAIMAFGVAKYATTASKITVKVWNNNGTNGVPGTVLASKDVTIQSIANNINANPYQYTVVNFTTPAAVGTTFYVGFEMTYASGDSVAIYTTQIGNAASHPYQGWEKWSDGTWAAYDTSWNVALSNYIFPIICTSSNAPVAAFTANKTSVCAGGSVTFTDQSTNSPTSWAWSFPGGTPTSSTSQNPTVTYNTAGTYNVTLTATNAGGNNQLVKSSYITVTANPTGTTTSTAVACFGGSTGSATVTAASGTTPYTYSWSGGGTTATISNKPAGTYTVTITDSKTCSATASATISQPTAALSALVAVTNAVCNGANGSATITASGGTRNYTYLWNNGQTTATINSLTAGTYTCTVTDANGCTVMASGTVANQASTLTVITSKTDATCGNANGTATATPNTSTANVTYLWSNGSTNSTISGLSAGSYSVTLTSSQGCTASATVVINNNTTSGLTISASAVPTTCGLINGTATVSGAPANATYTWSNGATTQTITNLGAATYTVTAAAGGCTGTATATVNTSSVHAVTTTTTNASCGSSNGSATAVVSPSGTYTYSWSSGATTATASGLAAGSYTVSVIGSNGCTVTATANVSNANAPVAMVTSNNVSCNGGNNGAISVTVSGGSSPYSYNWSNGSTNSSISNLSAGSYTLTITDNSSCKSINTINISQPTQIIALASSTQVNCFGAGNGSATVNASGGTGLLSYLWSNGATTSSLSNLLSGNYSVTVTDANSCSVSASTVVASPAQLQININAQNINCFGQNNGSATAVVSGGTGNLAYSWNNGQTTATASNLVAGLYSLTVTDANGCTATRSINVTQPTSALTATSSSTNTSSTSNSGTANVTAQGGTSPYTYMWNNGQTTASMSSLAAGSYSCTVTDSKGCTTVVTAVVNADPNGLNTINENINLSIAPIPAENNVNIFISLPKSEETILEIVNVIGQKVMEVKFGQIKEINYSLDIQNFAVGTYYAKIITENGFAVKAFIKKQ